MAQYLDLKSAHDKWKAAHDKVIQLVDQLKQWDDDKINDIARLNKVVEELIQAREFWEAEHSKVVEKIHQLEVWYKNLEQDRNLYKKWDADKINDIVRLNKVIEELVQAREFWKAEHSKVVEKIHQIEVWYKNLEQDRNLYKQWDDDKKNDIIRLNKVIEELIQAREFWKAEHAEVVEKVHQLEVWYKDLEHDRNSYKQWEVEHAKVVNLVHQWVDWFQDMQKNRDLHKRLNQEARTLIDTLLDHPFYYLRSFLHRKLRK